MNPIKILVADDEESILEIMSKKIASAGYDVYSARDGEEALTLARREKPDVVVLDITMPKLDGWQVLKELRQQNPAPRWQPVIIVSALNELQSVQRGLELQADHYLTKPCRIEDILKSIRLMLSLAPMRQ